MIILRNAEKLNYRQRWQYMIDLGKKSLSDEQIAKSLVKLSKSDIHYERMLALMSAHGSFNKEIIERLLLDKSSMGMGGVYLLAVRNLESNQIVDILPTLSKSKRMQMINTLLRENRTDIIEKIYNKSGTRLQKELLFHTSEEFFKENINTEIINTFTESQWRQITARFPKLATDEMTKIIENSTSLSWTENIFLMEVLLQLLKTNPGMGIELLEKSINLIRSQNIIITKYIMIYPQKTVEILLNAHNTTNVEIPINVMKKLDSDLLCKLVKKNIIKNLYLNFSKLRPKQRLEIYESLSDFLRDENGVMPLKYLEALPKEIREKEALYTFNLKLLQIYHIGRVEYLSLLSFKDALELGEPFLNQPDGELRSKIVEAIVSTGRYYPNDLDLILDFCLQRKNEQDPVRTAMLKALANLPPTKWLEKHLDKIGLIIRQAFDARDCSNITMMSCGELVLNILLKYPDFACEQLPTIVERRGSLTFQNFESKINDEGVLRLDSCLYPLLKTWIARNNAYVATSLISSFGCRIKSLYEKQKEQNGKQLNFVKLLIELTEDSRGYIAKLGLETLHRLHLIDEVNILIPKLLLKDRSWIRVELVSEYLSNYRQDLLDYYLVPRIYKNRFSSDKIHVVPEWNDNFIKWTATQQNIYSEFQISILKSEKRDVWQLYNCVSRIVAMPSANMDILFKLAKVDSKDVALRDYTLQALGRVDAGKGIDTLINSLDSECGRIAIHALRRSILEMPEKEALQILKKAPRNKVTVAKEIVRLVGEFIGEESYEFLCQYIKKDDLHKDVKIAILRAFWNYLNTEEVWSYFYDTVKNDKDAVVCSTISIPQVGLTKKAKENLCKHMTLLLKNENAQVRIETVARLAKMPIGYADNSMYEALEKLLDDIDVKFSKFTAKAMIVNYIDDIDRLVETFANVERGKVFESIVDAFLNCNNVNVSSINRVVETLIFKIIEREKYPSQVLRLAKYTLPPTKIISVIESLNNSNLFHGGVVDYNKNGWRSIMVKYTEEEVKELELKLRISESENIRRLGLAMLEGMADYSGWTEDIYKILLTYKNDSSLWVSEVAELIEVPKYLSK